MSRCSKRLFLTWSTGLFGLMSLSTLVVAICTSYWLYAREKVQEEHSTANTTYKVTVVGLWMKCVFMEESKNVERNCSYINYFKVQDKEGLGPTEAILLSLRKATLFPVLSVAILLAGAVIYVTSHSNQERKVLTFVAGIIYVIGGLLILIGIILYIGAITEEAGNNSKPSMDTPKFEYWYGFSFVLTITSFSCAEFTGVLAVYLYISRHKHSYRKKAERLQQLQTAQKSRSAISLATDNNNNNYNNNLIHSPTDPRFTRVNGCVGGLRDLPMNHSLANLPSYEYNDPRAPYHDSWSTSGHLIKAASTASMLNQQHYNNNQYNNNWMNGQEDLYDDEEDESSYRPSTPPRFGRQSVASVKLAREHSRQTLSSGLNPLNNDFLNNRNLCTPDSNIYRRTTPV